MEKPLWIANPDGEANEHILTLKVFSDRDGGVWHASLNDGEMVDLMAASLEEAQDEALEMLGG